VQLFNKHSPDDRISRVELRSMLNRVSVRYKIAMILITHKIEEEELITIVMGAAPEKYLSDITCEQRVKGNQMSLHDLEIVMYQLWRQSKGSIDQHTTEITLAAFEGTAINASKLGTKEMHALIEVPRRMMAQKLLLEEAEEEDRVMDAKELDSKELVEIVANKVTKRAITGRKKKIQA
jgi:ABC-type sugar transport system ATPase subunit